MSELRPDVQRDEAQFWARLINAYTSAQDAAFQMGLLLDRIGLRKNGKLDVDKVVAMQKRAHGDD